MLVKVNKLMSENQIENRDRNSPGKKTGEFEEVGINCIRIARPRQLEPGGGR